MRWWTNYYATNPACFTIGVLILAVLISYGSKLEGQITDSMRLIWKRRATTSSIQKSAVQTFLRNFRLSAGYQSSLRALKYNILPFCSAVAVVYVCAVALNHLAFNIIDPTGALCEGTTGKLVELDGNQLSRPVTFATTNLCFATGIHLTQGYKYAIVVTPDQPWSFGNLPTTTPKGFRSVEVPWWDIPLAYLAMPLRRDYFRRWFSVAARIGSLGMYEDFVDQSPDPADQIKRYSGETDTLKHDGELFLYVNDPVIAFPGLFRSFYNHNQGTAEIRVQRIIKKTSP